MNKLAFIVPVVTLALAPVAIAETTSVQLDGIYNIQKAWIAALDGKEILVSPAAALSNHGSTNVSTEGISGDSVELAVVILTEEEHLVSTHFKSASLREHNALSLTQQRELLHLKKEALKRTLSELDEEISQTQKKLSLASSKDANRSDFDSNNLNDSQTFSEIKN